MGKKSVDYSPAETSISKVSWPTDRVKENSIHFNYLQQREFNAGIQVIEELGNQEEDTEKLMEQ